jgi:hypothetical protein
MNAFLVEVKRTRLTNLTDKKKSKKVNVPVWLQSVTEACGSTKVLNFRHPGHRIKSEARVGNMSFFILTNFY